MNRDFKGVWIPKEIWLDERLTALDKIILTEIHSLDGEEGCYASNKYLADFCQCSEAKVSKSVSLLIRLGYVKIVRFDGRVRYLKVCLIKNENQPSKNYKADLENLQDNNIDNNIANKNTNTKVLVLDKSSEIETYGNEEINEMFDKWNEYFGYKPKNSPMNRRAVYNMLRAKDKGKTWLINTMKILREAQKDRFAGKDVNGVSDFAELQRNYDKIWKWGSSKAKQLNNTTTSIKI